jgi:DNA-binding MarR family transcriptional regulator
MESAGLSGPALDLLIDIGEHPGTSQQSCADRAAVTKGNVTQHLVRLEQRGLVQRETAGRCNELRLTVSGESLLGSVLAAHDDRMREFLSVLSTADQRDLRAILRRLDRGLRQKERRRRD